MDSISVRNQKNVDSTTTKQIITSDTIIKTKHRNSFSSSSSSGKQQENIDIDENDDEDDDIAVDNAESFKAMMVDGKTISSSNNDEWQSKSSSSSSDYNINTEHDYMDDGAATDTGSAVTENHRLSDVIDDDEEDTENKDEIKVGMLKARKDPYFDDDNEDDEDDEKNPAEYSGGGSDISDKYGDYENDNAHKPSKQNKNSFSPLGVLDKLDKTHENDDFDRHSFPPSRDSVKSESKNDAIKIISTPLGKVSIIYQSNTNNNSNSNTNNNNNNNDLNADKKFNILDNTNSNSMNKFKNFFNHNINIGDKQNNSNHYRTTTNNNNNKNRNDDRRTNDYAPYRGTLNNQQSQQQQPPQHRHTHSNHHHNHHHPHNSQQPSTGDTTKNRSTSQVNDKTKLLQKQITPVLTHDGKVALLYRGAQDAIGGKQKIDASKSLTDFPQSIGQDGLTITKTNYDIVSDNENTKLTNFSISDKNATQIDSGLSGRNTEKLAVVVAAETTTTTIRTKLTTFPPIVANTKKPILKLFKSDDDASRNTNEEENSILPNINRPPSEVLGIKKNQFIQFRITDLMATATPTLMSQDVVTKKTPTADNSENDATKIEQTDGINEHNTQNGNTNNEYAPNFDYDYYNGNRENNEEHRLATQPVDLGESSHSFDSTTISDVLSKAEVVNLAIIPAFEGDLNLHRFHEQHQQHQNDVSNDNEHFYNMLDRDENDKTQKHRHHHKDLSALHCAMQALVAIAAMATVFGMLGAYFKQRFLDQLTIMNINNIRFWIAFNRRSGMFV